MKEAEGVVAQDGRRSIAKAARLCNGVTRQNAGTIGIGPYVQTGDGTTPPQNEQAGSRPQDGGARAENPLAPASYDG
jgi:hypothetical protein